LFDEDDIDAGVCERLEALADRGGRVVWVLFEASKERGVGVRLEVLAEGMTGVLKELDEDALEVPGTVLDEASLYILAWSCT